MGIASSFGCYKRTFTTPVPTYSKMSGITVHYLRNSRAQRVIWLLEELQVPYDVKIYERLPSLLAPPELLKIHPLGKSPVITDGNVTIAESGAIIEYILTKYGNGKGQPPQEAWVENLYCEAILPVPSDLAMNLTYCIRHTLCRRDSDAST